MSPTRKLITTGLLFSVCYAALMAANDGHAQTASSNSGSTSASQSNSSSNSGAAAIAGGGNQNVGVTFNSTVPDKTTSNNTTNSSGAFSNSNTNSGYTTSDNIVRTTPTVYAPPVSGGNPCTLAVSGGVSVIGWGASAGGTFVDQDCANRQKIAMIHNAGYQLAARELMCNDKATYDAFKWSPTPCAVRPQFEAQPVAGQPVRLTAPMPQIAPPMVQAAPKEYPRCNARKGITDNCVSG